MSKRLYIFLLILISILYGCAHTAQKSAYQIKTSTKLNPEINVPADLNVGYYIESARQRGSMFTEKGLRALSAASSKQFDAAIKNIFNPYFGDVEPIEHDKHYDLIFKISSDLEITTWPNYIATLDFKVFDMNSGNTHVINAKKSVTSGTMYDEFAIHNAYATALKEGLNKSLNRIGAVQISTLIQDNTNNRLDLYSDPRFINFNKPATTSSGFFINGDGEIVTTWHGLKNCKVAKVFVNSESYPADVRNYSLLLDLAVLNIDYTPTKYAKIAENKVNSTLLGQQILTTGFPLANVLSGQPNLTVGNLSSIGGLKGRKGQFQITAPIQPGNSGGPVVTLDGTVLGMVTSKMNSADSENLNFASSSRLMNRYFEINDINFEKARVNTRSSDFARASSASQEFTVQIACYR